MFFLQLTLLQIQLTKFLPECSAFFSRTVVLLKLSSAKKKGKNIIQILQCIMHFAKQTGKKKSLKQLSILKSFHAFIN